MADPLYARRNPPSARRRRQKRGPPDPAVVAKKIALQRKVLITRRGYPQGTDAEFIDIVRRKGRWYRDIDLHAASDAYIARTYAEPWIESYKDADGVWRDRRLSDPNDPLII